MAWYAYCIAEKQAFPELLAEVEADLRYKMAHEHELA